MEIINKFMSFDNNYDYQNDFNAIYLVIDKIEELGYNVYCGKDSFQIWDNSKDFPDSFIIDSDFSNNRLENAYYGILAFCEWYLNDKKQLPVQNNTDLNRYIDESIDYIIRPQKFNIQNIFEKTTHNGKIIQMYNQFDIDKTRKMIKNYLQNIFITIKNKKLNRFEVIDNTGRVYVKRTKNIKLSYQDDNRTLKVFIK